MSLQRLGVLSFTMEHHGQRETCTQVWMLWTQRLVAVLVEQDANYLATE